MIKVRVRTQPNKLAEVISNAPRMAKGPMTEAAAGYLIGLGGPGQYGKATRGLRHYPPPKPTYQRTFDLRMGWKVNPERTKTTITNEVPYAGYVQGDKTQAYMHQGYWRTTSMVAQDNEKGMIRAAEQALERYLKEKGL